MDKYRSLTRKEIHAVLDTLMLDIKKMEIKIAKQWTGPENADTRKYYRTQMMAMRNARQRLKVRFTNECLLPDMHTRRFGRDG